MSRTSMRASRLAVALLASGLALAAQAKDVVLVMTIANYATQPLEGVKFDGRNALEIARHLGYDTSQATVLKDSQLSSQGLKEAIAQLSTQVQRNDRVFVYYSGHGYSQLQAGQCVQTLVGQDGGLVSTAELNAQLDMIKARTSEVFVLIDACHSGGLGDMAITRSPVASSTDRLLAQAGIAGKVFQAKAGEACSNPVNFSKQWELPPGQANTRAAFPQSNFTFIAAANEREVALDDNTRGGLATVNLLKCLQDGVPDLDGSGAASTKELVACAQRNLSADVPDLNRRRGTRWTAHTIEGYGNVDRALTAVRALQPTASDRVAAAPTSSTTPRRSAAAERTLAAFEQVVAGSDGNWAVDVQMPDQVRMGTKAPVHYSSVQPGYLSILYVGSDGKDIKSLTSNMAVPAATNRHVGDIPIVDCPGGCAGENAFLFVFSSRMLNTAWLLGSAQGGTNTAQPSVRLAELQCAADAGRKRNALAMQAPGNGCAATYRNAQAMEVAKSVEVEGYAARVVKVRGL